MRRILEQRNRDLINDLDALLFLLNGISPAPELQLYKERIEEMCKSLYEIASNNLADLTINEDQILEDVVSNTRQVTQVVRLLSSQLAIPVLRSSPSDRICLTTIGWLHQQHPETAPYPPAFIDGNCAIMPFRSPFNPIYFFPCVEQRGLLYQPLLFHEFGHLLYACHAGEMDILVRELQLEVENYLRPSSSRNDRYSEALAGQRQRIADTWYKWSQELFCDAVGFTIGGLSFLYAFSSYLTHMDRGDFFRHPNQLQGSAHPITWLRVQFLTKRIAAAGFSDLANSVECEWRTVAQIMGIEEDYHGYYDHALYSSVTRTIEDMLIEASPRKCTAAEFGAQSWSPNSDSIVQLFNFSWHKYMTQREKYSGWESDQIKLLLGNKPRA